MYFVLCIYTHKCCVERYGYVLWLLFNVEWYDFIFIDGVLRLFPLKCIYVMYVAGKEDYYVDVGMLVIWRVL